MSRLLAAHVCDWLSAMVIGAERPDDMPIPDCWELGHAYGNQAEVLNVIDPDTGFVLQSFVMTVAEIETPGARLEPRKPGPYYRSDDPAYSG